MTRAKSNKQMLISFFGEKAKKCKTDQKKIEFFDTSREAFFIESSYSSLSDEEKIPKELDDGYYVYANMKKLNERELEELKSLPWCKHPEILKVFLFDFCILNGYSYSKYFVNNLSSKDC